MYYLKLLGLLNMDISEKSQRPQCVSTLFTTSLLLHAVQLLSDIGQEDSKTFVDCSLKEDPIVIHAAFLALSKPYTKMQLNTFIDTFFQHSTKIVCERDGSSMH